jgi:serine/threonine protein kinase
MMDGMESDLETRETAQAETGATEPAARTRAPRLSLPSYEVGELIGKGGMGEVLLAYDPKIGR